MGSAANLLIGVATWAPAGLSHHGLKRTKASEVGTNQGCLIGNGVPVGNLIRLGLENILGSAGMNSHLLNNTLHEQNATNAFAKRLTDVCEALAANCEQVGVGQRTFTAVI